MNCPLAVVSAIVLASGCSSKTADPPTSPVAETPVSPTTEKQPTAAQTVTEAERTVLQACADGLPSMTIGDRATHVPLYITECAGTFEWWNMANVEVEERIELIATSGYYCRPELVEQATRKNRKSEADESDDTALLFKECGAEYYGLEEDQGDYLSVPWFFFQRTTVWLQEMQEKLAKGDASDKALALSLDMRLKAFRPAVPSHRKPDAVGIITATGAAILIDATSEIVVDGGLTVSAVEKVVEAKMPRLMHCYQKELLVNKTLEGTLVASFTVDESGNAGGISFAGLEDSHIRNCADAALKQLKFPSPKDGAASVSYPLVFALPSK